MKVLVTGANGFVGPFLSRELQKAGHEVYHTGREMHSIHQLENYFPADLTDHRQVREVIAWSSPEALVHLAGISHVASTEKQRSDLLTVVNIGSTAHICRYLNEQSKSSILLLISTGLVYQPNEAPEFFGFDENSPVGPINDYGWSKLGAEAVARIYDGNQVKVFIARPFNHIGPGQDFRFVAPSLAKRIIEAPNYSQIAVGNLEARRDFTDVRDIVRAYRLILELQPDPRTFVLGSGYARPISEIFDFLVQYSGKSISYRCAEDFIRREHGRVFGNVALANHVLGWQPQISYKQSLRELYDSIAAELGALNRL